MTSSRILAAAAGAAIAAYAGAAEARVIRSGGSTDVSNLCDSDNPSFGPFIGLFKDSDGSQELYVNNGDNDPIRVLVDDCVGSYYEFYADEQLQFEGSLNGSIYSLSTNEHVDMQLIYSFGGYQVESDTYTGGPFEMPEELQTITAQAAFSLVATLILTPKDGYSFYDCTYSAGVCTKTGSALEGLVFISGAAYMRILPVAAAVVSEVPLAPAALYFGAGALGLAGWRRRKKRNVAA
ncbi:MAG: hypothetical protein KAH44_19735 [Oricola sp.]|jgi:hypothetical protein|nr:hypothetical protein [Oricola sp.]